MKEVIFVTAVETLNGNTGRAGGSTSTASVDQKDKNKILVEDDVITDECTTLFT